MTAYLGTSLTTTLPAPIIAPSPILTPGNIVTLAPHQTKSSITTGFNILLLPYGIDSELS